MLEMCLPTQKFEKLISLLSPGNRSEGNQDLRKVLILLKTIDSKCEWFPEKWVWMVHPLILGRSRVARDFPGGSLSDPNSGLLAMAFSAVAMAALMGRQAIKVQGCACCAGRWSMVD